MNPLIFLDIDGVLNDKSFNHLAQSNTIDRDKIRNINLLLEYTNAQVVISSAWRYMVHEGAMTLDGFAYMMRTHGLDHQAIVGVTRKDKTIDELRQHQIIDYLREHYGYFWNYPPFIIIDDLKKEECFPDVHEENFVQTKSNIGFDSDALREARQKLEYQIAARGKVP